jgi:hypothetical protein
MASASLGATLLQLVLEIVTGAGVFVVALLALWLPTRRSTDAESSALAFVRQKLPWFARANGE